MTVHTDLTCSDCGFAARVIGDRALREGSSVREPNEALCEGCSSSRIRLVRAVDALPDNLADIIAKRSSLVMNPAGKVSVRA